MDGKYNGPDRRSNGQDHDILIEIKGDLKNLIANMNKHVEEDKKAFDKQDKRNDFTDKILYGGIGIILFVEFVFKVIK